MINIWKKIKNNKLEILSVFLCLIHIFVHPIIEIDRIKPDENFDQIVKQSINKSNIEEMSANSIYFDFFPGFQNVEYFKIFVMFVFILAISILLFVVAYFLSLSTIKDSEKLSQYECGFEPFDEATRQPFDVHFYVVGILFLIFDVEIALLFPWVLALKSTGWFSFISMSIFLIILTIGFFYEWHRGALLWPKDQILRDTADKITQNEHN